MRETVQILPMEDHAYAVDVREGDLTTHHRVIVDDRFLEDLGLIDPDEEELVRQTFEYLLENELVTEIDREFTLSHLADDDEEYVAELRARLSGISTHGS